MKASFLDTLVCPKTKTKLTLTSSKKNGDDIVAGSLSNNAGDTYPIVNGIPVMLLLDEPEKNAYALELFKNKAEVYDQHQHLSFETFYQDEESVRKNLIGRLFSVCGEGGQILEVSAGTGRDTVLIKQLMKPGTVLHVQDISMDMLKKLQMKLENSTEVCVTQSNACILPYPDGFFDGIYSFGGVGMNVYADGKTILKELMRVAKIGSKIVIGGLSLAPWLYQTEFGRILRNHNSHYENRVILEDIPEGARDVCLSWILNGAGFCLEFTVGTGEPAANFDFEIPGERGGTLRTRYYGKLEGVTPEARKLALQAREKLGISMHQWLDTLIKREAATILENASCVTA